MLRLLSQRGQGSFLPGRRCLWRGLALSGEAAGNAQEGWQKPAAAAPSIHERGLDKKNMILGVHTYPRLQVFFQDWIIKHPFLVKQCIIWNHLPNPSHASEFEHQFLIFPHEFIQWVAMNWANLLLTKTTSSWADRMVIPYYLPFWDPEW